MIINRGSKQPQQIEIAIQQWAGLFFFFQVDFEGGSVRANELAIRHHLRLGLPGHVERQLQCDVKIA